MFRTAVEKFEETHEVLGGFAVMCMGSFNAMKQSPENADSSVVTGFRNTLFSALGTVSSSKDVCVQCMHASVVRVREILQGADESGWRRFPSACCEL
jgi:hypothetical protein